MTNLTNCSNGDIRLVGGADELEGRVEVCYDNRWGTVCSNYWDTTDANVACGQLGFSNKGNQKVDTGVYILYLHSYYMMSCDMFPMRSILKLISKL